MTATQLDLFAPRAPILTPEAVDILLAALSHGEWESARSLSGATGLDDRQLRAARQASGGRVISGQKGYRLTERATLEEIAHAKAAWRSQARHMIRATIEVERVARRGLA